GRVDLLEKIQWAVHPAGTMKVALTLSYPTKLKPLLSAVWAAVRMMVTVWVFGSSNIQGLILVSPLVLIGACTPPLRLDAVLAAGNCALLIGLPLSLNTASVPPTLPPSWLAMAAPPVATARYCVPFTS